MCESVCYFYSGILLQSCKLAACLYVLVSFADATANINLTTGLSERIQSHINTDIIFLCVSYVCRKIHILE